MFNRVPVIFVVFLLCHQTPGLRRPQRSVPSVQSEQWYHIKVAEVALEKCLKRIETESHTPRNPKMLLDMLFKRVHQCLKETLPCNDDVLQERIDSKAADLRVLAVKGICGTLTWLPIFIDGNRFDMGIRRRWEIHSGPLWILQFESTLFNIPYSPGCLLSKAIAAYQTNYTQNERLAGPYCGVRLPWSVQTTQRYLHLTLLIADITSKSIVHFQGNYQYFERKTTTFGKGMLTTTTGFDTPSQPLNINRDTPFVFKLSSAYAIYAWQIVGPIKSAFKLDVSPGIVKDELFIYDGPDTQEARLNGQSQVKSSGHIILINWKSAARIRFPVGLALLNYTLYNISANDCGYNKPTLVGSSGYELAANLTMLSSRYIFCEWTFQSVEPEFIKFRFVNVHQKENTYTDCLTTGVLFKEKDTEDLPPICHKEMLEIPGSFVYTSVTQSVTLVFYAYVLHFRNIIEYFEVSLSLSDCQGAFVQCNNPIDYETGYYRKFNTRMGKNSHVIPSVGDHTIYIKAGKCINIHSFPQAENNMICNVYVRTEQFRNLLGRYDVFLSRKIRTMLNLNTDDMVTSKCKEDFNILEFTSSGNGMLITPNIVDSNPSSKNFGAVAVQHAHHSSCPGPSIGIYHIEARSDPCLHQTIDASIKENNMPTDKISQTLEVACGELSLHNRYQRYEFTFLVSGDDTYYNLFFTKTHSTCHRMCTLQMIVINEGNDRYAWHAPSRDVRWKTTSSNIMIEVVVNRCGDYHYVLDECYYILEFKTEIVKKTYSFASRRYGCQITSQDGEETNFYEAHLMPRGSWQDAENYCLSRVGHLVSLNTREELEMLLLAAHKSPNCGGLSKVYNANPTFIGLNARQKVRKNEFLSLKIFFLNQQWYNFILT